MDRGRPPKYKTPEEMQEVIDDYFYNLAEDEKPTIVGLALALNLSRQGLLEYADKGEFSDTVKRAKMKVELALEQHLYSGAVAGAIFNLKNNFGWKDKTEVDNTHKGELYHKVERTIVDPTDSNG